MATGQVSMIKHHISEYSISRQTCGHFESPGDISVACPVLYICAGAVWYQYSFSFTRDPESYIQTAALKLPKVRYFKEPLKGAYPHTNILVNLSQVLNHVTWKSTLIGVFLLERDLYIYIYYVYVYSVMVDVPLQCLIIAG